MSNKTYTKLFLHEYTKFNLMTAVIYLTAYELLKSSIINHIKGFFASIEATGDTKISEEYNLEVVALDASIFIASCKWLQKMEALSIEDIKDLVKIREHRHKIAHQYPSYLLMMR